MSDEQNKIETPSDSDQKMPTTDNQVGNTAQDIKQSDDPNKEQLNPDQKQIDFTLSTPAGQALMKRLSEKKTLMNAQSELIGDDETHQENQMITETDSDKPEKNNDTSYELDSSLNRDLGKGSNLTQTSVSDDVLDKTEVKTCENARDSLTDDPISSSKTNEIARSELEPAASKSTVEENSETEKSHALPEDSKPRIKFKKIELKKLLTYVKSYWVYSLSALFILIALHGLLGHHSKAKQAMGLSQQAEKMNVKSVKGETATLDTLQEDLNALLDKVASQKNANVDKQAVLNQLNQLTNIIDALRLEKSKAFNDFQDTVYRDHNALSAKLQSIDDGVNLIKSALKPVYYLDVKHLPFKVVSIDLIEGHPVVSSFYHETTIPLEIGFNLAGWQLLKSDYVKQTAEFIKTLPGDDKSTFDKIPHIKVSLNTIQ